MIPFGILAAFLGGALVVVARMHSPAMDPAAILAELEGFESIEDVPLDDFSERLSQPLAPRVLGPLGSRLSGAISGLLPRNYLERLRHKLVVAGISAKVGPEEFVALQAIGVGGGALAGLGASTLLGWGSIGSVRAVAVFAILGFLFPSNWLQRNRDRRQGSMRRDLPDVLDLLAISVEAGVGLEEFGRMLREMELGVPRRTALQDLKKRVEIPEVSNFVLSLIQADALGMPLGRVLRTQAVEMRSKRRQWAREKAAKLPVKIIFPLVTFILPALFVVVLGPAVMSISKNILH